MWSMITIVNHHSNNVQLQRTLAHLLTQKLVAKYLVHIHPLVWVLSQQVLNEILGLVLDGDRGGEGQL